MALLVKWLRGLWRLEGPLIQTPGRSCGARRCRASCMVWSSRRCACCRTAVRLEWPLTAPAVRGLACVVACQPAFRDMGEAAFLKRVLFDGLRDQWNGIWAAAVVCGVFWLTGGGLAGGVVAGVNVLLLGLACCLLYARYGFWTSVGFRWGWGLANVFLLGFGGGDAAIYRLYGVSEGLLTGGDAGPMHGLWATALLSA